MNGDIDFTLTDIYQDPSLLDENENGDNNEGDNPPLSPTAGFLKADMDWKTYNVNADIEDTTEEEITYQG